MTLASIAEATRLTKAGRLAEATALLRGLVPGGAASPPEPRPLTPTRVALPGAARSAGSFAGERHGDAVGTIDYKLYVPAGIAPGAPLVVMLHGCTQSPDDFAAGTRMNALADEFGLIVAYPAQTRAANAQRCWNWFVPDHQQRGRGEPSLIAGLTRDIVARHQVDPKRVFVAGLSAGGAAAAVMAETYPDLYAGVGVHSGIACGSARDLPSALGAMQRGGGARQKRSGGMLPTILFHGDRDSTVSEINARDIAGDIAGSSAGLTTISEQGQAAGGRRFTRAVTTAADGTPVLEQWTIHGAGHAWSGGDKAGSYTDPTGPDASREMVRFFLSIGR